MNEAELASLVAALRRKYPKSEVSTWYDAPLAAQCLRFRLVVNDNLWGVDMRFDEQMPVQIALEMLLDKIERNIPNEEGITVPTVPLSGWDANGWYDTDRAYAARFNQEQRRINERIQAQLAKEEDEALRSIMESVIRQANKS